MKSFKKIAMGCSIIGLTCVISACNNSQKENQNTTTMADILNGKEERKIAMTYDHGNGESPSVQWAGTIGNGKVEIYPYSNYLYKQKAFEFNDIKNDNMKEFKEELKQRTKEYSEQKGKKLNIKPEKAKLYYRTNKKGDTANDIILHYKAKAYSDEEKFLMANKGYSKIEKDHPKKWLEISTEDTSKNDWTQYHMFIEAKGNEKNLEKENIKDVKEKYNNIEVLK